VPAATAGRAPCIGTGEGPGRQLADGGAGAPKRGIAHPTSSWSNRRWGLRAEPRCRPSVNEPAKRAHGHAGATAQAPMARLQAQDAINQARRQRQTPWCDTTGGPRRLQHGVRSQAPESGRRRRVGAFSRRGGPPPSMRQRAEARTRPSTDVNGGPGSVGETTRLKWLIIAAPCFEPSKAISPATACGPEGTRRVPRAPARTADASCGSRAVDVGRRFCASPSPAPMTLQSSRGQRGLTR